MGDLYDEIEGEEEIGKFLNISDYQPFCTCKTTRRKYKKDGFGIDIDFVEYEDFDGKSYELAEIELMVQSKSEMPSALEKIISFAESSGLAIGYVRGKVLVYLKEKKPEHFMALVKSGVVRPSQI